VTVRVLIVDDERLARQKLRRFLEEEPGVAVIGECTSGAEAVAAIGRERPDLVFLDVQMPEVDGFEVLRRLGAFPPVQVIFVTAHDRYAVQAFEVQALDYLLKPFGRERFRAALARVRERRATLTPERLQALLQDRDGREGRPRRLVVRSGARLTLLPVEQIDWIESADNYARLHVGAREHLLRETLAHLEERLDPRRFVRVHRRAIVNLDAIAEVRALFQGSYEVRLRSGDRVPVGRTHRDHFLQAAAR
jgi:two-component system, LytTR family, response regulator